MVKQKQKRSRRELLIELLNILSQEKRGLLVTRLTSKINLSWSVIHPYLDKLILLDLVEKRLYKKSYKIFTTQKGNKLNHHFFVVNSIEKSFGIDKLFLN